MFDLKLPTHAPERHQGTGVTFPIPTLKAYAIEYAEFSFKGGFREHKELTQGRDFELTDDGLVWHDFFSPLSPDLNYYRLVIHYHGIRDYELLFPQVQEPVLRARLGKYYEEAEATFDNGVWLSFSLMCAAVYEGLLFAHFRFRKDTPFSDMITKAEETAIIDKDTARIMHVARELRNLVHANKAADPFVSRLQAMDMRTVMDRLIQQASHWPAVGKPE